MGHLADLVKRHRELAGRLDQPYSELPNSSPNLTRRSQFPQIHQLIISTPRPGKPRPMHTIILMDPALFC